MYLQSGPALVNCLSKCSTSESVKAMRCTVSEVPREGEAEEEKIF